MSQDTTDGRPVISTTQSIADELLYLIGAKTDAALREAVTRYLGRDDWAPGELLYRASRTIYLTGREVFSIDGVNIMEAHPLQWRDEETANGKLFKAERAYTILIEATNRGDN